MAWAIGVGGDSVRERVRLAFERGFDSDAAADPDAHADARWEAHGRLTSIRRRAIHAHVKQELLRPGLRELFSR